MKLNLFATIVLGLYLFLLSGCSNTNNRQLELALQTAGNNRQQLEKVIQHYQGDKQKEDAARFLIRNMLGKYYQEGDRIDKFHQFIDSAYQIKQEEYDQQTINDTYRTNNEHQQNDAKRQADLQQLNANFLITQIDAAFQVWQKPWNKHLSFDEFCEWILPYRIGNELPEIWREEYYNAFSGLLTDSILTARDACIAINNELIKLPIHVFNDFPKPADIKPSSLIHIKFGLCGDYTNLAIYAMRSVGIPVTTGSIPHWGHSNNSHAFNLLNGEDGNYYDFAGGEHHPGDHLKRFDGIPKVYQKTFSVQQTSLVMTNTSKEEIPAFFKNPFMKDITDHFPVIHPQTVSIPLNRTCHNKYAYLCVFDPQGWFPVDWGKISDKKVTFNHIGPDIIYQVNSYEDNSLQPLSSPFVVDSTGKVTIFECRRKKEDLYLERKYREPKHLEAIPPAFVGGRFQGSDYADFRIAEDLYTFTEAPSFKYTTIEVNPKKSYKYYRYQSSPNLRGNMAELEFYDTNSQQILKGEIIGTDNTSIYNPHATKYNVFDGDPLTFFHTRDSMSWAGLALPKPAHINKIRYIIRNDDNGIRKGNLYELFYIDESGTWASAGKQTAEQDELLIYKQIPQGTLFWLRNHTRGKEERIFTYEKGKQVWW
ncbi:transglutaminase domain-containing protein [Parabacteroides goldsteinii]|uniref:transglutaminase domain-containing protein n=1 Tax=Parabacteroides goldsteinii TaxID=328812 RepID=UPI003AB3E5B2